jgi:hypothetical protein
VAGLGGNACLGSAQQDQLAALVQQKLDGGAVGAFPQAFVHPICVEGVGTRLGVFPAPARNQAELRLYESRLRALDLPSNLLAFQNFTFFFSVGLLDALAKSMVKDPSAQAKFAASGIRVDDATVSSGGGTVVTTITGAVVKTLPHARFTLALSDQFSAVPNGATIVLPDPLSGGTRSFPELRIHSSTESDLDVGLAGVILALIGGLLGVAVLAVLGPLVGTVATVIGAVVSILAGGAFGGELGRLGSARPPSGLAGAGSAAVAALPEDVLEPRQGTEPGAKKIAFSYDEVRAAAAGPAVVGKISEQPRVPKVVRIDPRQASALVGEAPVVVLSAVTADLRLPLRFDWHSSAGTVSAAGAAQPRVTYAPLPNPGDAVRDVLTVAITDADRLSAQGTGELTITAFEEPPDTDLPPHHPSPPMPEIE